GFCARRGASGAFAWDLREGGQLGLARQNELHLVGRASAAGGGLEAELGGGPQRARVVRVGLQAEGAARGLGGRGAEAADGLAWQNELHRVGRASAAGGGLEAELGGEPQRARVVRVDLQADGAALGLAQLRDEAGDRLGGVADALVARAEVVADVEGLALTAG